LLSKSYLFLLLVLGLTIGSAVLFAFTKPNYGLDVRGGSRITFKMDLTQLKPEQRAQIGVIRQNLRRILEDRVSQALAVVEGNVQPKGLDEFIVELPGEKNVEKAKETLGTSASIRLYHAKNVNTPKANFREFDIVPTDDGSGGGRGPEVSFRAMRGPNKDKVIKFGDPEYAKMIEGWALILQGDDLASAQPVVHGNNTVPEMNFSAKGAEKLGEFTRRNQFAQENIAFVLDGRVLSIAHIKEGQVLTNNAFIDGKFDPAYVQELTKLLNSGALPIDLKVTSSMVVESTLGTPALQMMVNAGIISFVIIALFLCLYYVVPGFVALGALGLYVLFTLTVLKFIGATFSLASIAGFILSVGMAVDANILVFERVKEEMREGKTLHAAVNLGFKRAFPAIMDSNVCTILTSLVLSVLGTGPVKGFANTLIIGVCISLFTAVVVTRSLLVFLVDGTGIGKNPEKVNKLFGLNRQWFGEGAEASADQKQYQIVNKSGRYFLISLATIVPGVIFMFLGGFKPNVEFSGGFEAGFKAPANLSYDQALANLDKNGFKGANVKFASVEGERVVFVTVPSTPELKVGDEGSKAKIATAVGVEPAGMLSFTEIGPSVADETIRNAVMGIVISSLLIVLWLTIRFGVALGGLRSGIKFGLSAIGALVHDILVVVGVAAIVGKLLGWEVSALFITAMLTVIGFSVHDTIVIFDRIRENLRRQQRGEDFAHLCNRSITQSFARSINTSMTVIATLIVLIIAGTATPDLKFFCVTMLVGIVSGTYSSIFNAAPILYLWDRATGKVKGEEHTLIAEAQREQARMRAIAMEVERERQATQGEPAATRSTYSQVRRRSSAVSKGTQTLDDDEK